MRRSELVTGIGIFTASASLFVLLRTQQYLAVDGAIRCLSVYWLGRPTVAGNNHLLYFVNVFVWTKTLLLAGVNASDGFDFMRLTQWMNALAAAGTISIFWLLCWRATESMVTAWAATCAYAFSNAFLLHATSTAEPMMGLFWSFASIFMVASSLSASSRPRLVVGGALLLLAMATYESMVLIGPAELVLIYNWDERRSSHSRTLVLMFATGCMLGGIIAYVPAYVLSGTTTPIAMLRRFLEIGGGEQVYGGFRASKLVNLPIGFANSVVQSVPSEYQGIRALLRIHSHDRWILLTPAAVLLLVGWLVWTSRRLAYVWAELARRQRLILTCCGVALAFDIFPLIFWDPLYDKLWLQPLAVVFFASSLVFAEWYRLHRWRLILVPDALLVAVIVTSGFASALKASLSSTPWLGAARQLAGTLRSSDLLVSQWDPVSLLYASFWGNGAKVFDVAGNATVYGAKALPLLEDQVSTIKDSGGRIFFLGIIDMPDAVWKPYLEDRCHLSYHSLDAMRRCAKPVEELTYNQRKEVLWQLSPGCYKP
jgi:hypothetical protein